MSAARRNVRSRSPRRGGGPSALTTRVVLIAVAVLAVAGVVGYVFHASGRRGTDEARPAREEDAPPRPAETAGAEVRSEAAPAPAVQVAAEADEETEAAPDKPLESRTGRAVSPDGSSAGGIGKVRGREIVVDGAGGGEHRTIGAALGRARPGDVVTVRRGVYREEVLLEGKSGTPDKPIAIRADPASPPGSVVIDGSRPVPAEKWHRFISGRYGVRADHDIWWAEHNPEVDCRGSELMENCWPYKLHTGWYVWDGSRGGSARWGPTQLFKGDRQLQVVPSHPRAGKMADHDHADSEETQSEDYITASNPKFIKPDQWIWYDDGRTDGADEDDEPVPHPPELRHRIFVRLPKSHGEGEVPRDGELSCTVRSTGVSLSGSSYITLRGFRVRRAVTGLSVTRGCRGIRLQNLIVEEFGGGRKFYYSAGAKQHIYSSGSGIRVHSSSCEITGCLVQNGLTCGISAWGKRAPEHTLRILYCTIRNIGPHVWGGGWAHGKGKGIGTGNFDNILVARNVIRNCTNCGYWIDGGSGDRNIKVIGNLFDNCRSIGMFSETHIEEVLVAYNTIDGGDRCFRIGPISRRSRLIGNLFRAGKLGGVTGVYKSRMGGRTDTVDWFALAGNVFAECGYACFNWTDDALKSPHFYWDHNIWHAGRRARRAGPFILDWRPKDLEGMWAALRPTGKFLASGEHSRYVERSPVEKLAEGKYRVDPEPASLVTDELLVDLEAKRFLTGDEKRLLEAWRPGVLGVETRKPDRALAMGPVPTASVGLPESWRGPGSPLAPVLPSPARYLNRTASGAHIRINVGYVWSEITDSEGNTWLPCQLFREGSFGFAGEGRTIQVPPTVEIEDTETGEIYRTGRTRVSHYVASVPNGTYDVVLHFCNTVKGKLWEPRTNVAIEGRTVLRDLDAGGLGRFRAVRKTFPHVRVADGEIEIAFKMSDIVLCGVEIVRR